MVISIKILRFSCQSEFLKNLFYFSRSDVRIYRSHHRRKGHWRSLTWESSEFLNIYLYIWCPGLNTELHMLNMCLPPSCAHSRNPWSLIEHLKLCCWCCLCWEPWWVPHFTQGTVLPVWFCLFLLMWWGRIKKKLFKTLQPLVSRWLLQYAAEVGRTQRSHWPRWQYRGRVLARNLT